MRDSRMPTLQNDDYNTAFGSESIVSRRLEQGYFPNSSGGHNLLEYLDKWNAYH